MSDTFAQRHPVVVGAFAAGIVLLCMAYVVQQRAGDVLVDQEPGSGFTLGEPVTMGEMVAPPPVGAPSKLPILSEGMPEFAGIAEWMNGPVLAQADLRGKVVLIDFWTYSCINCIRTLPYITAWDAKYRDAGLVIVGVHTPEFAFEKDADNVRDAIARHGIAYPVALDNDYRTWRNYNNRYWPAKYLFDVQGRLRYAHFGEGDYEVTERNIQDLLREAGIGMAGVGTVDIVPERAVPGVRTPETYLGYERADSFASPERVARDTVQAYSLPPKVALNDFALSGDWHVEGERVLHAGSDGELALRYRASGAFLVMGVEDGAVEAEVTLDGKPVPAEFRGEDVVERDGRTYLRIGEHRLYRIIDARGTVGEHELRIRYLAPGVSAYAFTFG